MRWLLDPVILIDHFNAVAAATAFLVENGESAAVSVITRAEVLAGFGAAQVPLARELLDGFPSLPITVEIADRAAALRHSQRWKLSDALQAAVAEHHRLALVTRNTRDFQPGGAIEVIVPYRV